MKGILGRNILKKHKKCRKFLNVMRSVAGKERRLDRIQYRALRICLGATKTTHVNALLVEANEIPLSLRRLKLSLVYWTSMKSHAGEHISKDVLNNCWE